MPDADEPFGQDVEEDVRVVEKDRNETCLPVAKVDDDRCGDRKP